VSKRLLPRIPTGLVVDQVHPDPERLTIHPSARRARLMPCLRATLREHPVNAAGILLRRKWESSSGVDIRHTSTSGCAERVRAFEAWAADIKACGIRAAQTLAAGPVADGAAVRAALTTPWSNAQAEGQITKLKLIKRLMYGRAGFELLRRRVLLAA
jgi:hypothetical protein